MDQLVKIENTPIGDETVPTVNARELHEFLGSKQDFSTWIKARLNKARAKENKDFCTAPQIYGTANGGHSSRLEYFLSFEIAKHVALMENTDKGFEVRDYFIECEKQLRQQQVSEGKYILDIVMADSREQRALALGDYRDNFVKPLIEFKEQALPKVDFYDIAVASSATIDLGEAAKILKYKATGRNNLFKFLRREGVLMKNNIPKQEYVNKGWLKPVEYKVNGKVKIKTLVYQKGLDGIRKMLNEAGLLPEDR